MGFFESAPSMGGDLGSSLVKVTAIAFAGIFAKSAFTYVPPEHLALKSYRGEMLRRKDGSPKTHTGLTYVNPFRGKLHQVDLRNRTTDFADFEVELYRENRLMKHKVGASMLWRVLGDGENPALAEFAPADLHETIGLAGRSALETVLDGSHFSLLRDQPGTTELVRAGCAEEFADHGSELTGIYITEVARVDAEIEGNYRLEAAHIQGAYQLQQAHILGSYLVEAAKLLANGASANQSGQPGVFLPIPLGPAGEPFSAASTNGNSNGNGSGH